MAQREVLPDGIRITDGRGVISVRNPTPYIELVRCDGYARSEHVDLILESRDRIVRTHGKIALFDDLENLNGYDSDVRSRLTGWSRDHRPKIVAFHILLRSKIVAMGVSLANMAIGGAIVAHTRRLAFEQALAVELKRG